MSMGTIVRKYRDSLYVKVVAAFVGIAISVVLLSVSALTLFGIRNIRASRIEAAKVLADVISASAQAPLMFNDPAAAIEVIDSLQHDSDTVRAVLEDASGRKMAEYKKPNALIENPDIKNYQEGISMVDKRLLIRMPIRLRGELLGTLYLENSLDEVAKITREFIETGIALAILATLGATVLSLIGVLFLLRPLERLVQSMRQVTKDQNYQVRVNHDSKDEIGELCLGFNTMIQEIGQREQILREYQSNLERKVATRTSDLSAQIERTNETQAALMREQQQLRMIIQKSPIALAMLDTDLQYLVHSDAWTKEFEISEHSVIGRSHQELFPNLPQRWKDIFARTLTGIAEESPEDTYPLANGKVIYLRWAIQPWFKPEGSFGGLIIAAERIDALVEARESALATARMRSEFVANMSHELRTPLNSIIGFTDLLLDDSNLSKDHRDTIGLIHSSGKLLLTVLNDVLDLAKLESGKVVIDRQRFSPYEMASGVLRLFSQEAGKRHLDLKNELAENLRTFVLGDEFRITQILLNLLGNALKFTQAGRVSLGGRLSCQSEGRSELIFTIADSGIGIQPDKLGQIFEAFTQADGSVTRKYGGTGLGLTICRQLADLMGGRIEVESEFGNGSVFTLFIPIELEMTQLIGDPVTHTVLAAPPISEPVAIAPQKVTILVAEDNLVNQKLIEALLVKKGCEIVIAEDGVKAVDWAQRKQFDLILMDLQMPHMDGFEAFSQIRAHGLNTNCPIIALTAHAFEEHRKKCMDAGMTGYMTKPINRKELYRTIDEVLNERQSTK